MGFIEKNIKGDRIIWIIVLFLMLVSLLAVYSSTGTLAYAKKGGNTAYYVLKHLVMLQLGLGAMVFVHRIPPRYIAGFANVMMAFGAVTLLAALVMGTTTNGASRWLNLGFFSFQPSEFAKMALIVFVARHLALNQHEKDARKAFIPIMGGMAIICGLIFRENLSTTLLLGGTCMLLMFVGRIPMKYLLSVTAIGVVGIVIILLLAPHISFLPRVKTWRARVERFWNPDEHGDSASNFQSEQAKMAVATGGVIGRGPGNSYYRNFLPMAFSDFIFAIILEEYGLIGGVLVLLCYVVLMARAVNIARRCERPFHIFLVLGITTLIVLQAFVNMGVCVGIFPVTGQTLPLVSMGGTSNIFTGMAIGAILSVSRFNEEEDELAAGDEQEEMVQTGQEEVVEV